MIARWRRCRRRAPRGERSPWPGTRRPGCRRRPSTVSSLRGRYSVRHLAPLARSALCTLRDVHLNELTTPALIVEAAGPRRQSGNHEPSAPRAAAPAARQGPQVHPVGQPAKRRWATAPSPAPPSRDGGNGRAGLGDDLLLANEVVDATRLGVLVEAGARVTHGGRFRRHHRRRRRRWRARGTH